MVKTLNNSIYLGKLFGIRFQVNLSWFIIFAVVAIFLATDVFPSSLGGRSQTTYWAMGAVSSLLFFASVLIHELAHSLVSISKGIPVKSITLFIFGGAANITKEADKAEDDLLMAFAGPLSSCVLAGIFWVLYSITYDGAVEISLLCFWLAQINLVLAIFNMLPGFPLDGGRIFRSIIWKVTGNYKRSTEIASHTGRLLGVLLILGGIAIALVQKSLFSGVWMALIGWFLYDAAASSYKQVNLRSILQKYTVSQIPQGKCIIVSSDMSFYEFANRYGLEPPSTCFVAKYPDGSYGFLDMHKVKSEGLGGFKEKNISIFVKNTVKDIFIDIESDLLVAVQKMNEFDVSKLVISGDESGKTVHLDDIIRFVRDKNPKSF